MNRIGNSSPQDMINAHVVHIERPLGDDMSPRAYCKHPGIFVNAT